MPLKHSQIGSNILLKGHIFTSIKIHENPTLLRSMRMNLEKTILSLIKPDHIVKLRRFHQSSASIIAPTMIPTSEDSRSPTFLAGDRVCAMATHIMEGAYLVVFAFDEENGKASDVEGLVAARLGELGLVS